MFVRIRVPTAERRGALIVPGDAVSFDQQGEYLLLVNDQNMVERRSVKTGAQVGVIGAFAAMALLGFTFNLMTLFARDWDRG